MALMPRVLLTCLGIALAAPLPALAGVDICSDPRMQSRVAAQFVAFEESSFEEQSGAADRQYNHYDLLFTTASEKLLFGAGHRYSIFNIETVEPETNGHLHTFFLPLHVLSGDDTSNFRISAAAAMSASSNIIKDPGEYTTDALQLLAALIWGRKLNDRVSLQYGACGDHRFGEFRIYPAVNLLWQLHPDWQLQLGFPNSKLSYRISDSLSSAISVAPDGNEWYVEDNSHTSNSQFVYESYVIDWSVDWTVHDRFMVSAGVGREFDNRYEFTLRDRSVARLSADAVTRISVALEWRF